jgi:molybdopterin biosynthesis enzyme
VEAEALDSIVRKMPKAFVRWTRLIRTDGRYRVVLNPPEGMGSLAHMASANSLTIIPEGAAIRAGDKVEALPLDWMGVHSLMQG